MRQEYREFGARSAVSVSAGVTLEPREDDHEQVAVATEGTKLSEQGAEAIPPEARHPAV